MRLRYRVCNIGANITGMPLDVYFTDIASQTYKWEQQQTGNIDPGACVEGILHSDTDKRWNEVNFSSGDYTFRFGNVLTRIGVQP